MDTEEHGAVEFPYYCSVKVHRSICAQLVILVDRIAQIFEAIETVRPRSKSGILALCSLQVSMDRAKSLIQYCSESSKLYLAITGEKILSRSEKIRGDLESSLSQIQNMVPLLLAAKISGIIQDLRDANFQLDSADKEAGKIVMSLIRQDIAATSTLNNKELEALQIAVSKLNIASPVAALREERCIKKFIAKIKDTSPRKMKILKYLYYLMKKYGNQLLRCESNDAFLKPEESCRGYVNESASPEPPQEFICPISMRLMYDPSIIASGKTFERFWIEKWFSEGNDTCPATHMKLDHFSVTPNSAMKSLIVKWCSKNEITIPGPCLELSLPASRSRSKTSCSASTASFSSNIDDLQLQVSKVSIWSSSCGSDLSGDNDNEEDDELKNSENSRSSMYSRDSGGADFLSSLADLSWESQCNAVRDVKNQLEGNDQTHLWLTCYNFVNPLIKFLKDASKMSDVKAQRDGAELLLAILSNTRNEIPRFQGDAIYLFTSFIDSEIVGKALAILELLSYEQYCMSTMVASGVLPSILKVLETPTSELHAPAMKILCNLSINTDIGYHMLYLDYIPTLVRFLGSRSLARHSLETIKNLCSIEEARISISENAECVVGIGRLLESRDEQENALDILLSLCHGSAQCCELVMTEIIVESLVHISVNGNSRVKLNAMELLQLFGHDRLAAYNASRPSIRNARLEIDPCKSRSKRSSSRAFWSLRRDVSRFSKSR